MGKYWEQRWKDIDRAVRVSGWDSFRQTPIIKGIGKMEGGEQLRRVAEFVNRQGVPRWAMRDSMAGNPPNISFHGVPVSMSSVEHAFMAHSIFEVARHHDVAPFQVLEVGGGFGGLAWSICLRFPEVGTYYMVDDRRVLQIQEKFVELSVPSSHGFFFFEPERLFRDDRIRPWIIVNTRSFGEMDLEELRAYVQCFNRISVEGCLFYTVNWTAKVTKFTDIEDALEGWEQVFKRAWPKAIDGREMVEACWRRLAV